MVALVGGVVVGIGVWIEQEIGTVESFHMGSVVIVDAMRVHEFPRVIGIIASILQPNGEEVLVKPSFNELGISTCINNQYSIPLNK